MGTFNIKRTSLEFNRVYIELIRPFLNGCTDKECDVLAEIIRLRHGKKDIKSDIDRMSIILNTNGRKQICENIGISSATLRNALVGLRKKRVIREDNTITPAILPKIVDGKSELIFNFDITDG